MQRKTLEHLPIIQQDRQEGGVVPPFVEMLKEDRVRLAEKIPYFQGSITAFQSEEDVAGIYNSFSITILKTFECLLFLILVCYGSFCFFVFSQ
jgi:hypothetical protein